MMSYLTSVGEDSKVLMIYIILSTLMFYALLYYTHFEHKFILFAFFLIFLVFYQQSTSKEIKKRLGIVSQFNRNEKSMTSTEYVFGNIYSVHETPKKIKYIHNHPTLMACINNLSVLRTYDKAAFNQLVVLLESFFELYHLMLMQTNKSFSDLHDLRMEILRTISTFYLNVPQYSQFAEGNIYELIEVNLKKIQAITFKCMKRVANKYRRNNKNESPIHKPPYAFDASISQYEMY